MAEKIDFKDVEKSEETAGNTLINLLKKYPELVADFGDENPDVKNLKIQNKKELDKARTSIGRKGSVRATSIPRNEESTKRAIARSIEIRRLLKEAGDNINPKAKERLEAELLALSRLDTGGRGGTRNKMSQPPASLEPKDDDPRQPGIKIANERETILDDDESGAKLSFFENLKERFKDPSNRKFLENLGMQLGTNLTRPMNPGENRSLVNQVATSIQGATDKSIVQDKARVEAALKKAQTEKALKDAQGGTDLYKKATEFVISSGVKPTDPEYGQAVAKAMRQFGVKDITTAQVNAIIKINALEQELKLTLDPESEEYKIKTEELNALKRRLDGLDIVGGSSGDGRSVVTFEDVQSGN